MEGYLGETPVAVELHPEFKDMTPKDWALHYLGQGLNTDGAHHKQWSMDQAARVLHNTPVHVTEAKWENGESEFRDRTGAPTQEYLNWRIETIHPEDREGVTVDNVLEHVDNGIPG